MLPSNMPTNQSKELANPQSDDIYNHTNRYLVEYINSVLEHLLNQFLTNNEGSQTDDSYRKNVLIVSELTPSTIQLIEALNDKFEDIHEFSIKITHISENDFLTKSFDKRYELGLFIDKSLLTLRRLPLNMDDESKALDLSKGLDSLKQIAIKLRDLFAQQCLLFVPNYANKSSLKQLGFIRTSTDYVSNFNVNCWQFNLYDYKHKPDWLNAKYWANPENFDKYRW